MRLAKSTISTIAAVSIATASVGVAPTFSSTAAAAESYGTSVSGTHGESLSEEELKEIGLTKEDALKLAEDTEKVIAEAEQKGEISAAEATQLRKSLLSEADGARPAALPV